MEQDQREATKMIRGLQHVSYEDRPKQLELFRLEKTSKTPYCGLPVPKRGSVLRNMGTNLLVGRVAKGQG